MKNTCALLLLLTLSGFLLASDPAVTSTFPTCGVSVVVPSTLQRVPEGTPQQVARWSKAGSDAIIAIEASPAGNQELEAFAQKIAASLGGSIAAEPAELDGEHALLVSASPAGSGVRPLEAVIAKRNDVFYFLTRNGSKADDGQAEVLEMSRSWKWLPIEPPSKHIELMTQSVPVLDNLFSFRPPTLARPYEVQNPKTQLRMGIFNYQSKTQDFFVGIDVFPRKAATSLDVIGEIFADNAAKNYQAKEAIVWEHPKGGVERLLSQPFVTETTNPDGSTSKQLVRLLIFVTESSGIVFTCAISAEEESARKVYAELVERIGESISYP